MLRPEGEIKCRSLLTETVTHPHGGMATRHPVTVSVTVPVRKESR